MKFFLDTANLDEIRTASKWGIIDGVTTNPSLIAKEGTPIEERIAAICGLVDGPVSAEVIETEAQLMIAQGRALSKVHRNVVVKCPLTRDGIEACSVLGKEGIRVNVTLCFSAAQALIAAKVGACFVSPFVGRLDDIGQTGIDLIRQTVTIYEKYGFGTQVLAASLRGTQHVIEAALAGAHIGTMPFKVMHALFSHPLTDKGLAQFLDDYHKVFAKP
jgi:transaldolase